MTIVSDRVSQSSKRTAINKIMNLLCISKHVQISGKKDDAIAEGCLQTGSCTEKDDGYRVEAGGTYTGRNVLDDHVGVLVNRGDHNTNDGITKNDEVGGRRIPSKEAIGVTACAVAVLSRVLIQHTALIGLTGLIEVNKVVEHYPKGVQIKVDHVQLCDA